MKLKKFNIFELVGVYLGDGSIVFNPSKRVYKFEIAGNAEDEKDYFFKIANFLKRNFDVNPKVYTRYEKLGKSKSLRLIVDNKKFLHFLMDNLGLNFCNKTFTGRIPSQFLSWDKSKHVIRGLFETDGCLYFSKTRHSKLNDYPRLEIKTSSKSISKQLLSLLRERGFRVNKRKSNGERTVGIYLSGNRMLDKWVQEIGFSKIKTATKHQIYKRKGYYTPYSTLQERLNILGGGGQAAKLHFRKT